MTQKKYYSIRSYWADGYTIWTQKQKHTEKCKLFAEELTGSELIQKVRELNAKGYQFATYAEEHCTTTEMPRFLQEATA